jgi:HK97 family phage major capsid protein
MNMDAELMAALDELQRSVNSRLDEIDIASQRMPLPYDEPQNTGKKSFAYQSYVKLLRYGPDRLDTSERKAALILGDDPKGGYLAVPEFDTDVIRNLVQFSPIRGLAKVMTTTAGAVLIPKRTATGTAAWVGEVETRSEAQPAYGMEEITVNEAACYVDLSLQMTEDSSINMGDEVTAGLAEEHGRLEGNAMLVGDGLKKPEGVLGSAAITTVPSGHASQITADALITALYSLPSYYRSRSTWLCNGLTLAAIRKLRDGTGQYLWQPGLAPGQPEHILGRPVVEAPDAPDIASGAKPIIIGSWQDGYRVVDRLNSMTILVDRYTLATSGKVRLHSRRRVGAGVVQPAAFRAMVISAS